MKKENKIVVLKLGGSIISDKSKKYSFRKENVSRLVKEIKDNYPERSFIIVHGGGSFGHPKAKEYQITSGLTNEKQKYGFYRTHEKMLELNKLVLEELTSKDLPAFPIAPSSTFITKSGEPNTFNSNTTSEFLKKGFIPVLYGDVSLDTDQGINILSGDQIIKSIVANLKSDYKIEKVIFLADVDGIYSKDPSVPDAELLKKVTPSDVKNISGSSGIDVTGGIKNKVNQMLEIAKLDPEIEIRLANGLKDSLTKILNGEDIGTEFIAYNHVEN